MCGRYAFVPDDDFFMRFNVPVWVDLKANYNAAPGQYLPIITRNSPNQVQLMHWGLIPPWAKDKSVGYRMINARSETVTEKAAYKSAFKKRRCLIPASGFYEWRKDGQGKTPFFFSTGKMIAFAGLYEVNTHLESEHLYSYTILTTKPSEAVESIHDRMPVILNKDGEEIWLNGEAEEDELLNLLLPYQGALEKHEVSKAVNRATNNSDDLILAINSV